MTRSNASRPDGATRLGPPFGGKDPRKDRGRESKPNCQPDISTLHRTRHFYLGLTGISENTDRFSSKTRLRSVRSLGDLEKALKSGGFLRVHKSFVVNLDRVREVRLRKGDDNDWELKLDPPVNVVLPVGRGYLAGLRRALGF